MSAFAGLVPGRVVEQRWSRWRPGTGAVLGVVLSLVSQGLVRGNGVTGDEPNVNVYALALGRSGELYVGGRFSAAMSPVGMGLAGRRS